MNKDGIIGEPYRRRRMPCRMLVMLCFLVVRPAVSQDYSRTMVLGRNAMRRGEQAAAREFFRRAASLTDRPHALADALLHEGRSYRAEGAHEEALKVFERVLSLPGLGEHQHERARIAQARWEIALTLYAAGDKQKAARAFLEIPDLPAVSSTLASDAVLQAGYAYRDLQDDALARAQFLRVLSMQDNPAFHRSRAWLELGSLYAVSGDRKAALKAYAEVQAMRGIPLRHRSLARYEAGRLATGEDGGKEQKGEHGET